MADRQITNMEVKKKNRNRIFRHILKCDQVSNPEIAYELKISLPTVTQNTRELLEKGLIQEMGEFQSTGGRRAKALSTAAQARVALGLDLTKNHLGMALVDLKGQTLKYQRIGLPFCHEPAYYRQVCQKLEGFLGDWEREGLLGLGISFPGIVDLEKGEITESHIMGVKQVPFSEISRYFSYPCYFLNDANAGAYAEGVAMEQPRQFFYLSLSNTVGGAIFDGRELTQGSHFRCGEVGHMTILPEGAQCYCGKKGCLDVYCSAKRLSERTEGKLGLFFEALEAGEQEAVSLWQEYTSYLAIAVNNIHMVLDCDIMLGGYVGSYLEPHMEEIRRKVFGRDTFGEQESFVKACSYKTGAAALGAARRVIEAFIEEV